MTESKPTPSGQGMRLFLDMGPLLIFFAVNSFQGLAPAIAVFSVATVVSLAISWRLEGKVRPMPLIGGFFVLVFGGVTLFLDDEFYFKIKPTVVNLIFASFLCYAWIFNKPILKNLFDSLIEIDDSGWRLLTRNWMLFFVGLAIANEVAWRTLSTDGWVTFKVFGLTGVALLFSVLQTPIIMRHAVHKAPQDDGENKS